MGAIAQHYGLDDAAVLALGAGVDVLLIAQNTTRHDDRAAERVIAAITRAIAAGTLPNPACAKPWPESTPSAPASSRDHRLEYDILLASGEAVGAEMS